MPFSIYYSRTFDDKLEAFLSVFKDWVDTIEEQLIKNPYVGDPICVP